MRGSNFSSSAGAAPSGGAGLRSDAGDRKVGGSGGDAGVSVVSGDWGGVRGRGRGGGGIASCALWYMCGAAPQAVGLPRRFEL